MRPFASFDSIAGYLGAAKKTGVCSVDINYIKALYNMKGSIILSNESIQSLKETSLKNLGIERSMNQAIRFLDQDLSAYIDMTEQMINSIERIIGKSRFIIGDISLDEVTVKS